MSKFAQVARRYVEKDLPVIPICPGTKAPGSYYFDPEIQQYRWGKMREWTKHYSHRLASPSEIEAWEKWPDAGIGMTLGPLGCLVALDYDFDAEGIHAEIQAMVPDSPVKKMGEKGFTAFYLHSGEETHQWKLHGDMVVELLSDGRQTVLPPTVHPCGAEYRWLTEEDLTTVDFEKIPQLPVDFCERVDDIFRRFKPAAAYAIQQDYSWTSDQEIESALSCIPADDYNTWIEVGMALKTHLGDQGFPLWDQWSRSSLKYQEKRQPGKWKSFKRNEKKIESIFYWAYENGWVKPAPPPVDRGCIIPGGNILPRVEVPIVQNDLLLRAPGLLGDIVRWMMDRAPWPSAELAMAAALPMLGAVRAHRVATESDLRTNLYTLGMAASGAGKDHNRKCANILLIEAGLTGLIGGDPASGAGLLKTLAERNGRAFLQLDEFGRTLKHMSGKNAGPQAGITTLMLKLFSEANEIYAGTEYGNADGKRGRTDIDQPCLNVHATSVPQHIHEALSSSESSDGFMARWLYFEEKGFELVPHCRQGIGEPPEGIVSAIKELAAMPTNAHPRGGHVAIDLSSLGKPAIRPQVILMTPEAQKAWDDFMIACRARQAEEIRLKSGLEGCWSRSFEHSAKIALTASWDGVITKDLISWANDVALMSADRMAAMVSQHVSDNETEGELKKVLRIIEAHQGITQAALTRKTQNLNKRRRTEILNDLVESHQIQCDNDGKTSIWRIFQPV